MHRTASVRPDTVKISVRRLSPESTTVVAIAWGLCGYCPLFSDEAILAIPRSAG